jgi:ankyrin repeat protein
LHQLLADSSANISAGDENDRTPLHYAAIYGNIGAIQALVAAGVDLESRDAPGGTPLHLASEEGQVAAVSYLLDLGSPIETTDNSGCRAIHRAVYERHDSVVELLLQRGASVLGRGESHTPLWLAAHRGSVSCCKLLLDAGAPVDDDSIPTMTPLGTAADNMHPDVVTPSFS